MVTYITEVILSNSVEPVVELIVTVLTVGIFYCSNSVEPVVGMVVTVGIFYCSNSV